MSKAYDDSGKSGSEDLNIVEIGGENVALVLPVVDESWPPEVCEGVARRRLVTLTGRCPCGATFTPPSRQQRRWAKRKGQALHVAIWHERDCPAGDQRILSALAAAGWSR
jgi:hypothetical protein